MGIAEVDADTDAEIRGRAEVEVAARPKRGSAAGTAGRRAAVLMLAAGWGANQFTSLLGVYRARQDLSEAAATGLFAVYVLGLVPGLLVGGPLADRRGRRPVALAALAAVGAGTLLMIAGATGGMAWLLPGRLLTGAGVGGMLAAGTAWVKELSTGAEGAAAAARRGGLFLSAGFALGGLVAALVAQWAPNPLVTAYLPHVALSGAAAVVAWRVPETLARAGRSAVAGSPRAPRRGGRLAVAFRGRAQGYPRALLPLAPWVFTAPAVGFVTLPGLVDGGLTGWQTVYAGVATCVVPGMGLLGAPLARRLGARTGVAGLGVVAAGFALAGVAAAGADPVLGMVADVVLGAGYGLAVAFGLTVVAAGAPAGRLAWTTGLFWAEAYIGMFAPYALVLLSGALGCGMPVLLGAGAVLAAGSGVLVAVLGRGRHRE